MTDPIERLSNALSDRYAIERELGSGGMATVYLAEDLKHDRKVALKVMRPELSAILGGERFLREIRIAAKLNHPHILALHDSGEADGFLYYVMPHVEGESLRSKLNREKQLPIDEAITITQQVAAALDYAHQEGVIHRDIKPENILIHRGEAVVADFGIALAVSTAAGTRLTDTGLSLGTPEYMSPEHATGEREITARSDVYSLGAVVYEMLAGEPPHTGNTVQAIIAKVVSVDPQPISRVRHTVPSNVDAAVMCALAKVPADRFGSGVEFADALANPTFTLPTVAGAAAAPLREGPWKQLTLLAFSIAALFALTTLWGWLRPTPEPPRPVTRMSIGMPQGEEALVEQGTDFALSPDGTRLLYVGPGEGGRQLWVRALDQLRATPVPGTDGAQSPFFGPGGEAIGFHRMRQLSVVSTAGSPPVTVVDSADWYCCGDWGPDGMVYFTSADGAVTRVPATGGEPEVVTRPDTSRGELKHRWVDVLPNGKGALFTIWRGSWDDADIAVVEFAAGEVRVLVRGFRSQYAVSGHLIYMQSDRSLSVAPFDQDGLEVGPPTRFLEGVTSTSDASGGAEYALSETGTLVYRTGGAGGLRRLVWVGRDGVEQEIDPEWTGLITSPRLSPDGTRLAVDVYPANGNADIWVMRLDRGLPSRLTFEGRQNIIPAWTPDGRSVTFTSVRATGDRWDIWRKRADGSGAAELLLDVGQSIYDQRWSPTGEWLVYRVGTNLDERDLYAIRPEVDSEPIPLAVSEFDEQSPSVSPRGRWLAYVSNESGRDEVYVQPFPNAKDLRWQVSTTGGTAPLWAHNGRELFYVNASQELVVAEVVTQPTFEPVTQHVLFSVAGYRRSRARANYAVSLDDQRFVMVKPMESESAELVLVLNWFEELKERAGNQ
jgi:serine/threonine-protein kinase